MTGRKSFTATTSAAPLLIACVLFGVAAAGCRPDFAPYNRLIGLRVLTIQSEPPTPNTGESATLRPLIFTPTGNDPTLTYAWSWCPYAGTADQGYACLISEEQVAMVAGQLGQVGPIPPFDLGAGPTATLTNSIDRPVLEALCAGVPGTPRNVSCDGGFPIQVRLIVTSATDQKGVETVFTTRWRFDDVTEPNTNPIIEGINATVIGGTPQPIDDQGTVTLPRAMDTALDAVVTPEQAESYTGVGDDDQVGPQVERLFLTWFVETGSTEHSRTSYIQGSTDFPDLLTNTWFPALKKDYAPDSARLFIVLHDSRAGISWRSATVQLGPDPP